MFTFFQQIGDWFVTGDNPHLFAAFFVFASGLWLIKRVVSFLYRPYKKPFDAPTAGVVPVAFEVLEDFEASLRTHLIGEYDDNGVLIAPITKIYRQFVVVVNGGWQDELVRICRNYGLVEAYPGLTIEQVERHRKRLQALTAGGGHYTSSQRREIERLTWLVTPQPGSHRFIVMEKGGKRDAILEGMLLVDIQIVGDDDPVILIDSDVQAAYDAHEKLIWPFRDPKVGGVTGNQRIYHPKRNYLTRFADWMEDIRWSMSMKALSVPGTVGCLPGRMIAVRRRVIENVRRRYKHEMEFGIDPKISDDRRMTIAAQEMGFKTVYQSLSRVLTDAPTSFVKYVRQQYRWSRGSQLYTMRQRWFYVKNWRYWLLALFFWGDIIIPFWWIGTLVNMAWKIYIEDPVSYGIPSWQLQALLAFGGLLAWTFFKQIPHLRNELWDIFYLPAFVVMLSLVLTPIRVIGYFCMAHTAGWGTRAVQYERRKGFNWQGLRPPIRGAIWLMFWCMIGPLIETPDQFLPFLRQHAWLIGSIPVALVVLYGVLPEWKSMLQYSRYLRKTAREEAREAAELAALARA